MCAESKVSAEGKSTFPELRARRHSLTDHMAEQKRVQSEGRRSAQASEGRNSFRGGRSQV